MTGERPTSRIGSAFGVVTSFAVAALVGACGASGDGSSSGAERRAATTGATATTAPPATPPSPTVADAAYAPLSPSQRLDLYLPASAPQPHPLVVFIHGGAWMTGDKRSEYAIEVVRLFLAEDYAVASVNYRLSGEATFPAQILDVKAAVRWLRANAATFDLDPDRVAAAGESAGGHLAALLGTSTGEPSFDDPALGNPGVSSAVQAVVDFYGPVDLAVADAQLAANPACAGQLRPTGEPDPAVQQLLGGPVDEQPALAAAANPTTYLLAGRAIPPFFIAHGDADCIVPYQGSVALHRAIEATAGAGRSRLVIVRGSGHFTEFDALSQLPAVLTFLAATIGRP